MRTRTFFVSEKSLAARRLTIELMCKHGLHGWSFAFNNSKQLAGVCKISQRHGNRIELSVHFCERNPIEVVRDTILHEIAHALAGLKAGHGPAWRAVCLRIGAKPVRCYDNEKVDMPKGPWQAQCPNCKKIHDRHRRPKRMDGWWCRKCGPELGKITWAKVFDRS